jgi:hypothetical protein
LAAPPEPLPLETVWGEPFSHFPVSVATTLRPIWDEPAGARAERVLRELLPIHDLSDWGNRHTIVTEIQPLRQAGVDPGPGGFDAEKVRAAVRSAIEEDRVVLPVLLAVLSAAGIDPAAL